MMKYSLVTGLVLLCINPAWSNSETPSPTTSSSNTAANGEEADPIPVRPPAGVIPSSLLRLGIGKYYSPYALVVDKASRTLTVWQADENPENIRLVNAFATDIGKKEGDKHKLNDHRTPEGVYFLLETMDGAKLNYEEYGARIFTMDYPNFFDQRERKTGYGIWLHAIPETKTLKRGSRGCVVVRNEVIKQLANFIDLKKTPIIVENKVNYVKPTDVKTSTQKALKWIESWRKAWQSKDIENYISFYADDFKSQGMTKAQWREYKKNLNDKYQFINVSFKTPVIYRHKSEWVVRFLQDYESDKLSDFGEKFLYLKENENGELKIVGEVWQGIANDLIAKEMKNY